MNFSDVLVRLRAQSGLTQEKLAEQLKVSRQAVQKWESGAGFPEMDNIIRIAKLFGVTIDALVLGSDRRALEEMRASRLPEPSYGEMHAWESYASALLIEYRQSVEEGRDLAEYKDLFAAVARMRPGADKSRMADILFDIAQSAGTVEGYAYDEPDALEAIRALRAPRPEREKKALSKEEAYDRIYGAWLGRVCGCLLGKPVEGIRTEEFYPILKQSGNWPLGRYLLSSDITEKMIEEYTFRLKDRCYADTVSVAPVDDDTNYVVLAQVLVERCGRDFTPADVMRVWLDYQPKNAYCTAERVAYCNFIKCFQPPDSAKWQNPYREWIGAQIRGDYFGYINPGDPEAAADMAWRDASISHVKNGIYGEMFAAAMIAEAAVERDIGKIIEAGLGQIPATSRLYEAVSGVLAASRAGVSREEAFARIHQRYDEHSAHDWCLTTSNAVIVASSLLYGNGDFGESICAAVQAGFDTDCNGATVGSILGMRGGAAAVGEVWRKPINGQLDTSIFGVGRVRLADMAEKTLSHLR